MPRRLTEQQVRQRLLNKGWLPEILDTWTIVRENGTWRCYRPCSSCGKVTRGNPLSFLDKGRSVNGTTCKPCTTSKCMKEYDHSLKRYGPDRRRLIDPREYYREGLKSLGFSDDTVDEMEFEKRGKSWHTTYYCMQCGVGVFRCVPDMISRKRITMKCRPCSVSISRSDSSIPRVRSGLPNNVPDSVYVIKVSKRGTPVACKVGITGQTIAQRFAGLPSYVDVEQLYLHEFGPGTAREIEKRLHRQFHPYKLPNWVVPMGGAEGNTELFDLAAAPDIIWYGNPACPNLCKRY